MQDINDSIISITPRESYPGSCISISDSVVDINPSIVLPDQPYPNVTIEIVPEITSPQEILPKEEQPPPLQAPIQDTQMALQIVVILTSKKEIKEARVRYISKPEKEKSIFQKSRSLYEKTNIVVFMVNAAIQELTDLKVEYYEQSAKMFLFSKKTLREHPLSSVMIHGGAGLHFGQLIQHNTDLLLQNYCILAAHDHIVAHLRFFKQLSIVPQFQHVLRSCFRHNLEGIAQVFDHYSPLNNINTSEFFIYFFFALFKDSNCHQLIKQFSIPLKIVLRKVTVLLQYKFYSLFKPPEDYKCFLFYVYFHAAIAQKVEEAALREIAEWNVLNQDDQMVQTMLSLLQKHESCFFYLLGKNAINNRILINPKIPLQTFMEYKLAFCERALETIGSEDVSELLSRFVDDLTVKAAKMEGPLPVDLSAYRARVVSLFVRNSRLREQINAGELYSKLKAKAKHSSQMGQFFFSALQAYLFPLIPQLLVTNYECTILPLIVKPEVAEENKILLQHFQEQNIDERQLLFILRIWQEMNSEEYNINVIEFVLLKFVAFNPHFDMPLLERIIQAFTQQLKDVSVTQHCKSLIPAFCLKIANEMKHQRMRDRFAEWAASIQPATP